MSGSSHSPILPASPAGPAASGLNAPATTSTVRREWALILGAALAAAALSTFFFAPRFIVWRAFGVPGPLGANIEIFRSPWFLHQVEQPFEPIENLSNVVIQWRMLFPLLAHYLHLPRPVLLALPWIGCIVALVVVARILWTHSRDTRLVWLGTLLVATCSWYLVGTGWVLYFDGWLMAAMLLATFGQARWQLLLAALLAPWIDERFVLTLPLLVTVRWVFLAAREPQGWREITRDVAFLAVGLVPYLGIRGWAWTAGVLQPSKGFFEGFFTNSMGFNSPIWVTLLGAWHGLRAAWLLVLALPVLVWRTQGPFRSWALGLMLFFSLVVLLGLAGDISRSASVVVPALLAAVIMIWTGWRGRWVRPAITGICAANLLIPTMHVVTSNPVSLIPVYYLYAELGQLKQPPDQFNPKWWNALGQQAQQAQKMQDAFNSFSTAVGLDSGYAEGFISRGVLLFNEGVRIQPKDAAASTQQKAMALEDFGRAIQADPHNPNGWLNRGIARREMGDAAGSAADLKSALNAADEAVAATPKGLEPLIARSQLRQAVGDPVGAAADLEKVLELAPADWPNRSPIEQALAELKKTRPPSR